MRSKYKFTDKDGVYFITATVIEWLPVFTNEAYCQILTDSLKFCQQKKQLRIYAYVILENHIHLVCEAPRLSQTISDFKKFTARKVIDTLKKDQKDWLLNQLAYYKKRHKVHSTYQFWQEGVHPQLIVSDQMLNQKIAYIHNNPVKRGLIEKAEHWRFSSARNYLLDDHSIIKINNLRF